MLRWKSVIEWYRIGKMVVREWCGAQAGRVIGGIAILREQ